MSRKMIAPVVALIVLMAFSGCLGNGDNGGDGGYNINTPVSELIVTQSDLSGWNSWEGSGYAFPVVDYEEGAMHYFIDAGDYSDANHSLVVFLMELDGFEGANETYQAILADHEGDGVEPIDLGTEGFYFQTDGGDSVQIFFKKYRYVAAIYYIHLDGELLSIQELQDIGEIQQDKIQYD